ncbi:MAG: hypothetical protein MZW92_65155 [Comamonadaceae bacterium]|nr:hypothetical protein [Comamonadaceae bacterium]
MPLSLAIAHASSTTPTADRATARDGSADFAAAARRAGLARRRCRSSARKLAAAWEQARGRRRSTGCWPSARPMPATSTRWFVAEVGSVGFLLAAVPADGGASRR